MRVFISYGHDANAALVDRIDAGLRAAGHLTWRDTSIKGGDDWRDEIVTRLRETEWVLAFLSAHSVRAPGVCLDEIAIALSMRGGGISTVLVEPEEQVRPPPPVADIQWVDMQDWAARQAADPDAFDLWFARKLDEIRAILADPGRRRYADDIRKLTELLRPEEQGADIPPLIKGFVGRAWLLERVDAWRRDDTRSHLAWLAGDPGQGKSAFAAWIAHAKRRQVVALNLCRFGIERRNDPRHVLRTLAFQIATRLPDYRGRLLNWLQTQDRDGTELASRTPADLFDALLIQRLPGIDGGRSHDPLIVVIDGLDETVRLVDSDLRSELAELLAEQAQDLPRWTAVLVTGRPESPLLPLFANCRRIAFGDDPAGNAADLRVYVQGWRGTGDAALTERIVEAARGNFAYVRALQQAVAAGRIDLARGADLPRGLFALYYRWFARQFQTAASYAPARQVLSVLAAAGRPVPEAVLTGIFGWTMQQKSRVKAALGSLLVWQPAGVAPFHQTMLDWLVEERSDDGPTERFIVDLAGAGGGRDLLWRTLWSDFAEAALEAEPPQPDAFVIAELPKLLALRARRDLAKDLAAVDDAAATLARVRAVAEARQLAFAWSDALAWWDALAALAAIAGGALARLRTVGLLSSGDVLRTQGKASAAEAAFRAAVANAKRLDTSATSDPLLLNDLVASHLRIGDACDAGGDRDGALAAYSAAQAVFGRVPPAALESAGWQRTLSIVEERIGEMREALHDLEGALDACSGVLAIRERLAADDPGNAAPQRDLAVGHERIGDIRQAQGRFDDALRAYDAALRIRERLAAREPGNLEAQRDLSVSHQHIGAALQQRGDLDGALGAYLADLAIAEFLAGQDPGNAEWQHDLAISHSRIGALRQARGDVPEALAAFRAALAIRRRLAEQDAGNAAWQHELVDDLGKLAKLAARAGPGTLAEAREYAAQALAAAEGAARRFPHHHKSGALLKWASQIAGDLEGNADRP